MKTYNEQREENILAIMERESQEDHGILDCQLTDEEWKEVAGYERSGWLRELHRKQRVEHLRAKRDKITPALMLASLSILITPNAIFLLFALWNY